MGIGIILLVYFIEIIKYTLGVKLVYKEEVQRKWGYVAGGVVLLIYLFSPLQSDDMDYIVAYLCAVGAVCIGMEGKILQHVIKTFVLLLLIASIEEVIAVPMRHLEEQLMDIDKIHYWINLLTSLWGLLILIILDLYMKKGKKLKFFTEKLVFILIVISGVTILCTITALNMALEYGQNNSFQIFVDVVVSMAYICICILCWFLIYFQRQNEEKTRMLEIERELKESQNRYYQLMLEKEAETRKFRHDLNNHLFCLKAMADREDTNEIKKYLEGMNGEMQKIKGLSYSTGNELFDAILNDKLSGLPENISITVKGTLRYVLSIEEIDMCTIFSNLLQNAVEELSKISGQGFLELEIRSGQQFTEIEIKNSAIKKVKLQKDGLPKTSKEDDTNHGIGLKNVKKTIEKCHGEFVITSEESFFSVRVSFSK